MKTKDVPSYFEFYNINLITNTIFVRIYTKHYNF